MRLFFLSLLLTAFTALQAQTVPGVAKDEQGSPLTGATVSLLKDTAVVKYTLSKQGGAYTFNDVQNGQYRISICYVGYKPAVSAPFEVAAANVTAPAVVLAKTSGDLGAVT